CKETIKLVVKRKKVTFVYLKQFRIGQKEGSKNIQRNRGPESEERLVLGLDREGHGGRWEPDIDRDGP
ncbi:MAG: hypothetical protein ACK559_07405, partial [bacterium]